MIDKLKGYILNRLNEHSFWVGVGIAVAAASALPGPWNWISLGVGIVGSLIPDGKVFTESQPNDSG